MPKKKSKPAATNNTMKIGTSRSASKQVRGARATTKGAQVVALLERSTGASIQEMMKATGWQAHSVRGFMGGSLKRQGKAVTNDVNAEGERRYRLAKTS